MLKRILTGLGVTCALLATATSAHANAERAQQSIARGDDRVHNGVAVQAGKAPWVASVKFKGMRHCGGTLVNPRIHNDKVTGWNANATDGSDWVITAAHCLYKDGRRVEPQDLAVGLGGLDYDNPAKSRDVIAIIEHPNYDPSTIDNDIALLLLSEVAPGDGAGESIALPTRPEDLIYYLPYAQAHAFGWGRTETNETPQNLQEVRVPVMDQDTCSTLYREAGEVITDSMICAGYRLGEFDSCSGDSGGPLAYRDVSNASNSVLVGVVSWGIGCARANLPGVYTSIRYNLSWLAQSVEDCEKTEIKRNCTSRASQRVENVETVRMISGKVTLFPEGCQETGLCKLATPIRYIQGSGVVWESGTWSSDALQTGTTDGASIPVWAQPFIGKPFEQSYLKAAILHDHYCYQENHVRPWQQVHKMFYDALIDSGISEGKAKTMYYGVLLGGPRWKRLVAGEKCGPNCFKAAADQDGAEASEDWQADFYDDDRFVTELNGFAEGLDEDAFPSIEQIEAMASEARSRLLN